MTRTRKLLALVLAAASVGGATSAVGAAPAMATTYATPQLGFCTIFSGNGRITLQRWQYDSWAGGWHWQDVVTRQPNSNCVYPMHFADGYYYRFRGYGGVYDRPCVGGGYSIWFWAQGQNQGLVYIPVTLNC